MSETNNYNFRVQNNQYGKTVISCSGSGEKAVLPNDAYIIADDLFKGHTELREVVLPEHLNQLGGFVFDGCENLHEIALPNTLEDMWQYALTRCGIKKLTIPGSIHTIVPFTCYDCEQLKTVTIEEGVVNIGAYAFKNCFMLRDVFVPKSVKDISEHAFDCCPTVKVHRA